ncbi:MAG TPA: hypothetical protein VNY33_01920, partial [Gaiellaceae bacterium]|nr:hypothetical protein [Gaiellaceae bacterium]
MSAPAKYYVILVWETEEPGDSVAGDAAVERVIARYDYARLTSRSAVLAASTSSTLQAELYG